MPLNRYCFDKDNETQRIIVGEGGPLEQILDDAIHTQKQVIVTLKTDKVYIGVIDSSFTPGQLSRTIHLLPNKSGFRTAKTKTTVYTTNYDKAYGELGEDFESQGRPTEELEALIEDFAVVIALDDIATISFYWPQVDARYFKHSVPRTEPLPEFKTAALPPSEKTEDPILRTLSFVGDLFLYPVFEEKPSKRARRWRIGWGIGIAILAIVAFLFLISN